MILAGVPVPEVITLVVMMVMGDLIPGLLVTPGGHGGVTGQGDTGVTSCHSLVAPDWVVMRDWGGGWGSLGVSGGI